MHWRITIVVTIVLTILNRVEPGNFRIGRVGRAHNEYYEMALKDRYGHYAFDDGKYFDDVDDPNYVYFDQKLNGKWGKTYDNSDNLVDWINYVLV